MQTTRITFPVIKLSGTMKGDCFVCEKSCTRHRTFEGTINPFNVNPDGSVKTADQVRDDLRVKIVEWKKGRLMHARCE